MFGDGLGLWLSLGHLLLSGDGLGLGFWVMVLDLSNLLSARPLVRFSHIAPKGASKMLRAT